MACIGSHEDEGVGSGTRETTHVTNGVSRAVKKIEATIAEEVMCSELADQEVEFLLTNLANLSSFKVGIEEGTVLLGGVGRQILFTESRSDHKIRGEWKRGDVADVI